MRYPLALAVISLLYLNSCTVYRNKGYDDYDAQAPTLIAKSGAGATQSALSPLVDCSPYLSASEAQNVFGKRVHLRMQGNPQTRTLSCSIALEAHAEAALLSLCTISAENLKAQQLLNNVQMGDWRAAEWIEETQNNLTYHYYGSWLDQSEGVQCQFAFASAQDLAHNQLKVEKQAEALSKLLSREL